MAACNSLWTFSTALSLHVALNHWRRGVDSGSKWFGHMVDYWLLTDQVLRVPSPFQSRLLWLCSSHRWSHCTSFLDYSVYFFNLFFHFSLLCLLLCLRRTMIDFISSFALVLVLDPVPRFEQCENNYAASSMSFSFAVMLPSYDVFGMTTFLEYFHNPKFFIPSCITGIISLVNMTPCFIGLIICHIIGSLSTLWHFAKWFIFLNPSQPTFPSILVTLKCPRHHLIFICIVSLFIALDRLLFVSIYSCLILASKCFYLDSSRTLGIPDFSYFTRNGPVNGFSYYEVLYHIHSQVPPKLASSTPKMTSADLQIPFQTSTEYSPSDQSYQVVRL